jgi:hypothetical protein
MDLAQPPKEPLKAKKGSMFSRTGSAFTAEYSLFLIALGVSLSNLAGLVYVFFSLIVNATNGGGTVSFMSSMFTLWLLVSSAVTLPLAFVLWARTQGEIASNHEYKGELPKGGAKGFRTFWIILSGLSVIGLTIAALYAPIAALAAGANGTPLLLSVSAPSVITAAILLCGICIVTRSASQRRKSRVLLWCLVALTAVLFAVNYTWASSLRAQAETRYPRPSMNNYNPYDDVYDDTYYNYSDPNYLYR